MKALFTFFDSFNKSFLSEPESRTAKLPISEANKLNAPKLRGKFNPELPSDSQPKIIAMIIEDT